MKILKYILIYLAAVCTIYSQTQNWFVFQNPNPNGIIKSTGQNWAAINIFESKKLVTHESQKLNSPTSVYTRKKTGLRNWQKYDTPTNYFGFANTSTATIPGNSIICTVTDRKGNIWIGTELHGLVKFDGTNWVQYNSSNSELPDNSIYSLAVDKNDIIWIGTRGGLARLKGSNWIVFKNSNSSLPSDVIYSIAIEKNGTKWIGTSRGLVKYDNRTWKIYNTKNSKIPGNFISALNIDDSGNKWIGTFEGLVKYDGNTWQRVNNPGSGLKYGDIFSINFDEAGYPMIATWGGGYSTLDASGWTRYTKANSSIPDDFVSSILIDKKGTKWIGTLNGLMKCRGGRCVVYNSSNSPLPSDSVYSLLSDQNGNLWIGTNLGLAVYREGGLKLVQAEVSEFNADVEDNEVLISWQSDLDGETDRFEIEKRTEQTDWKNIAVLDNNEQLFLKAKYAFLDRHNNIGQVYYRLKKITITGGIKYSNEIEATIFKPYLVFAHVDRMNESADTMTINFSVSKKGTTNILITNKYRQTVSSWNFLKLDVGYYQIDFPLESLPAGNYTFKLQTNNKAILKEFTIY